MIPQPSQDTADTKDVPGIPPADAASHADGRKRTKKRLILAAKLAITLLVFLFIGRELYKSAGEFRAHPWEFRFGWILLSGIFYLLAYLPASRLWYLALHWLGQRTGFLRAVKAFYYSQLGKYVPGKAMVVVIRSGMVTGPTVKPGIAAVAVFYETFTMMAAGAFIAALIVLVCFGEHWKFSVLALLAMLVSGIPLLPPVFRLVLRILRIGRNAPEVQESLAGMKWRNIPIGMALMAVLWLFFGLSLWAAIRGLGIESGPLLPNLPRFVAVTAMAVVLGFAVPISPGGLGIREAVLAVLLVPYLEGVLGLPGNQEIPLDAKALALVVSIEQRIISIIAELAAAGGLCILSAFGSRKSKNGAEADSRQAANNPESMKRLEGLERLENPESSESLEGSADSLSAEAAPATYEQEMNHQ